MANRGFDPSGRGPGACAKRGGREPSELAHLLLLTEFDLHLLVPRLVLADAVPGDEIAAYVGEFGVLLSSLLYEPKITGYMRVNLVNMRV